jgi:hypothetical protein
VTKGRWLAGAIFLTALVSLLGLVACSDSEEELPPPDDALIVLLQNNDMGEAVFSVKCDPPRGNAVYPMELCETLQRKSVVMLHEKKRAGRCWIIDEPDLVRRKPAFLVRMEPAFIGDTRVMIDPTLYIHVFGLWEGKQVNAQVDACHGNATGEQLWVKSLFGPRLWSGFFKRPEFPSALIP